jgi:hypothetical protein
MSVEEFQKKTLPVTKKLFEKRIYFFSVFQFFDRNLFKRIKEFQDAQRARNDSFIAKPLKHSVF